MKHLVIYDKQTNKITGYVKLGTDSDAQFYPNSIEIPLDHPAIYNQHEWHLWQGKLVKKDKTNGK